MAVQYRSGGDIYGTLNIYGGLNVNGVPVGLSSLSNFVFVNSVADLPTPIGDVIYLVPSTAYYFSTDVDLQGKRIVANNNALLGSSSEISKIRSSGKSALVPLISANTSLTMSDFALSGSNVLGLSSATGTNILDVDRVSFVNCVPIGRVSNYDTALIQNATIFNSTNFVFDGTIGTIGMNNVLLDCAPSSSLIILPSTLTLFRRFRISYSAVIANAGETAFQISPNITTSSETIISDTVNYTGAGTPYLSGISSFDDKILLVNNRGIQNTTAIGQMTMTSNLTSTPIPNTTIYVKMSGNTIAGDINQKFTNGFGRLTYTGGISRNFRIMAICSAQSGNNNVVFVGTAKNGVLLSATAIPTTTSGTGRAENMSTQGFTQLSSGEYIELFVRNSTATNNVTITDLNMAINEI